MDAAARLAALGAALDALPELSPPPTAVLPVTARQWRRSIDDADLDASFSEYVRRRAGVVSVAGLDGPALARRVRPKALKFAAATTNVCMRLEILCALDPGEDKAPIAVDARRTLIAQDAHAVLRAVIEKGEVPPAPTQPALPDLADGDDRDVLLAAFGISAGDLVDEAGSFCDSRVLALYRLRLPELQQACDPILDLVADRPPSVFTAVSAVRDLVTSVSPWITLRFARDIRARILAAFEDDPDRTRGVLLEALAETDKEASAFDRLKDQIRRAEVVKADPGGTERDFAIALLGAYKHMVEGITRRWVWTLLRLTGLNGSPPTVGALGAPSMRRLGELGLCIEAALVPAMRNADAHEDFTFEEDTGLLSTGEVEFRPEEILARLTDLDVLQRALIVGRLAAFADEPALAHEASKSLASPSASSAMTGARQRFGHAGQPVRSFTRNRDRLDIVLDDLRPEACNPCFLALTQAAQILPRVSHFVVRLSNRDEPIIDLTGRVLHENWPVLRLAVQYFSDGLPQETFLPALTWTRLARESVEDAAQVAAWLALNNAQHAILDAEANPEEFRRLPQRFEILVAAVTSTIRVLPGGSHLDGLVRARRIALTTPATFAHTQSHEVARGLLLDRILRIRDRLGGPPAILPTVDPTPMPAGSYPHQLS